MKKKLSSKKCIAVILAVVMIITSIPLMMVGAEIIPGSYDPAPYFSEEAIKQGADAWLDDDGNIQVEFPAATPKETFKGEATTIDFYILELVDMGAKNAVHQKVVLDTIKVTGTSATFKAADIGTVDFENNRYSVTITAVDNENWFSLPIYTTVTDVPVAKIDPNQFTNFSTSATAVREIMTFEKGTDDGAVTQGSQLLYMGVADEAGTEDLADNVGDTSALRFIMNDMPSGTQTFDTSYSRQTWDFKGAEEVWYWMDLTDVELKGVSFRLRANEKLWSDWGDGSLNNKQYVSDIVYSTKGTAVSTYTGEDPYVYVQREDGGWNKVMLKSDGTVDIGNFKGYVRIPLKFICSETDSYADVSNQDIGQSRDFKSWGSVQKDKVSNWCSTLIVGKTLVDKAGTSISDALLLHQRVFRINGTTNKFLYMFNSTNGVTSSSVSVISGDPSVVDSQVGTMLAIPLDETKAKTSVAVGGASTDRAYIANGTIQNREAGLKAIEDIYNAGFSIEGCSDDSLQNSFFVDNIFFYRSDGGAYSENTLDGNVNTGSPMTTYYNQDLEIARIIFDEIDKRILDPDWADYRELEYILELIEEYKNLYISQGKDASFLNLSRSPDTTGMAGMATKLNRTATWEKAWLAYAACSAEGTIDTTQSAIQDWFISNGRKDDLVPNIVNTMEKLPKPESITSVSKVLRKEIIKLWKAYSLLNLGQLDMLGKAEEEKILKYVALLDGGEKTEDEFIVGQRLADNPFIVFNDFENHELGEKAWQLEDNKDAYTTAVAGGTSNLANDWRHTKGLVTYTTNGNDNITDSDYYGYVTTDSDKSQEAMDGKLNYNASWATVTNDGYLHSKGVNLYSDSSFTASENNDVFHTVTVTKDGNPIGSDYSNSMRSENLGGLAQTYSAATSNSVPLALIFYVDFTQIKNFYFTVNVFTRDGDGNHVKCRVDTGIINGADRKYWILDNETGEWEIIYTTSRWVFNSAGNQETATDQGVDFNKIEGYKGYLMIPLYHIKQKINDVSSKMLDQDADLLNNIFAVQFCIGGANPTDMDEKSIVIDNVGFSYSPDSYSAASSRNDKSYAEVFGAKSLPAKQFEDAVTAIDPYDEITLSERVQAAQAIYNTLPDVQKQFVEESYKKLELYTTYINNPSNIPQPDTTANNLVTWITNNLNSDATGAKVEDVEKDAEGNIIKDYDLPYPGFVIVTNENGKPEAVPNYAAYGLTAELAVQLEEFYNNSYIYYSVAEKQQVKDAGFLNAYNAAMRCLKSLESIKTDALTFLPEITGLYTVKYDYNGDGKLDDKDESVTDSDNYKIGNFLSIADRDSVKKFFGDNYSPLQYYSKTSIDDGSIYPQLQNTSRGFTYFLKNTETYNIDGEEIKGGILAFQEKLQTVYNIASEHIENRVRFSADELQYVKDILDEYNSFLPAYYNVEELYELEQKIVRLFSVSDITIMDAETDGSSLTTVALNNNDEESMKDIAYVDLSYIAALLDTTVTLQAVSDLKLTQTSGTTFADLNSFTVDGLTADTPLTLGEYDNLYPDEVFTRIPLQIAVDPDIAMNVPKDAVYEGSITFNVYETADIDAGLTGADLVPIATLELPVTFTGTLATAYTVTIPAKVQVDWDTTDNVDVSYSVEASLANKKLLVSVEDSGAEAGKLVDSTGTHTLAFTATNFKETTFTGDVAAGTTPPDKPSIKIEQTAWDNAPVGAYSTQLTYTVDVTS